MQFDKFQKCLVEFLVATKENIHPGLKSKRELNKYVTPLNDLDELTSCTDFATKYAAGLSFFSEPTVQQEEEVKNPVLKKLMKINTKKTLSTSKGAFYAYNIDTDQNDMIAENAELQIDEVVRFSFIIQVLVAGDVVHRVVIDGQRGFGVLRDQKMIMWIDEGDHLGNCKAWGFVFTSTDEVSFVNELVARCTTET